MKKDEAVFYILLVGFSILWAADAVFDLNLADRITRPTFKNYSITFADVKPILANRCDKCHDWTYEKAFRARDQIKFKVSILKNMPPSGMPDAERDLIKTWVDQGAKP